VGGKSSDFSIISLSRETFLLLPTPSRCPFRENQALCALISLYKNILGIDLAGDGVLTVSAAPGGDSDAGTVCPADEQATRHTTSYNEPRERGNQTLEWPERLLTPSYKCCKEYRENWLL
jgi:hypothetical protein